MRLGLALALLFVITFVQADDKCRSGCRGGHGHAGHGAPTFRLQEGTTYKYNFDSKIEITLSSAENQKTTTEVKAQVLVTPEKDCNQVISLQNVQIIGADGKKYNQIPDVNKPIRINYHDGHLEDSICTVPGDTQNSLNIKRAIASLLQANLKSGYETDVFGQCPTDVTQHKEGNILVVQKSRNLNKCAFRESISQDFLATAFNLNSEIKSSPILNGDYSAKLRIKNGVLDQATSVENYLYVPFSVGNNGAKAVVESKLQLVGASKGGAKSEVSQPRSIIFEDPHPVNSPTSNVNSILAAVKETAKTVGVTVNEKTAKEFVNLVKILRVSNKDDLLAVYNQVKAGAGFSDKVGARRLFLDALFRAGNGDTIEVAIELLKNKELNEIERSLLLWSLPLVRHTTESSINKAAELLDSPQFPKRGYLEIGSLVGRHCRQHSCKNVAGVNRITQKLVQALGDGRPANRKQETELIYILKALANTGTLSDSILSKITGIAQDKKAPNRLRAVALETFLADPCKDKLRDSALSILKDIQQDSEIRIKAYLALAQCPNAKVGNAIKALLDDEPSYQVGGFIVSHIRQIRASANPDKELARQHLGFINLPKRYPIDPRKWSYSGEFSYSVDTLGLSSSVESNVIYSQQSFLPRSASLNLTADVFGHTFNFLELEARQENLDRLIEHYLGRRGILPNTNPQKLWENAGKPVKEFVEEIKERVTQTLRSKRDVTKAEIDAIGKQVQIKDNELNTNLDLDASIKAFGAEVAFLNFNEQTREWTPNAIVDKIVQTINKGVEDIKKFDEVVRSNLLFLDAELAYPTGTGFPLRLGAEGSANIQVKASGAIDIRALLKKDTTIKAVLIPSATIEIAGRLTLDALLVENGLKVISTLHTSTGGDLTVQLFNGDKGLDIKFALPLEKQNILSAQHDIVFHTRELGAPEKNTALKFAQNKDFSICVDQLDKIIGLTFCGEVNGPNLQGSKVPVLPFPFAGDAKLTVTIEKEDLSHYHYREVLYNNNDKLGLELSGAAISKNNQKKVSLEVEAFLIPEKYFKATLVSPIKSAVLEGKLTTDEREKSASLRLSHDGNEYYGKVGVGIAGTPAKQVYKPILEYRTPQTPGVQQSPHRIDGQIIVEKQGQATKYIFDNVKIVSPSIQPITISGNIGQDGEAFFSDVTVGDGQQSGSLKGRLQVNPNLVKYNAEVKNTLNPQANFHVKGEISKRPEELKNFFQIIHGPDLSSKTNILTLENAVIYRNNGPGDYLFDIKNSLRYPLMGLYLRGDYYQSPKALNYDVNVQYSDVKLGSDLKSTWNKKADGIDYDVKIEAWALGSRLEALSKRTVNGEQSKIANSVKVNGKEVEVSGTVKHHVRPQDIDVGSDLTVKIPQHGAPIKVTNGLKYNGNEIDAFHKVASGGTVYADIFFKARHGGNNNGAIKINTNNVVINGQLKDVNGNGNAELVIELPQLKRSVKLDSTFTTVSPTYNLVVNLYPLWSEDKNKKLTVSTNNQITEHKIDSKNVLDFFGNKLEANVKCQHQGDFYNGQVDTEAELILPDEKYFLGKLQRNVKTVNNVINGNGVISLDVRNNKNHPGKKVTLSAKIVNTNPTEKTYDVTHDFVADDGQNNFIAGFNYKSQKTGDGYQLNTNAKLTGSVLENPWDISVIGNSKNEHRLGDYQWKLSHGPNNVVSAKTLYDVVGEGHPYRTELSLDGNFKNCPFFKTIKSALSGSVLTTDKLDVKGAGKLFIESVDSQVLVDYDGDIQLGVSDKEGRLQGKVRYGKQDPISVDAGYSRSEDQNQQQLRGDGQIRYGNKHAKIDTTLIRLPKHEYKLDLKLDTSNKEFANNRLQVHTKRSEDNVKHESEVILTTNGQKWTANTDIILSEHLPSFDVQIKSPQGKLIQVAAKITKLNNHQLGGEIKVINQIEGFVLETAVDADVPSVDDFHIKVSAHCPALKLEKVVVDAQNKPTAKTGRRIQINAKSGNKNILQGSTSYTVREEKGKQIIEGSGSFKVQDQTQSANFKFIRQNLNQQKNGETGVEISFDASLGSKAIDAEFKVTNKQFRILNSYCEEKKQCAYVEIDSKTLADDLNHYHQELEIAVDLRKLGVSHEFGLKAVTDRKNLILDHTVDVHFQSQDSSKYQYSVYLHPQEAGVSLTTPKRIVSLEATIKLPAKAQESGRTSGEIVLYLDKKNQPNQKTGLTGSLNFDLRVPSVEGEIKFTNPALQRPLTISASYRLVETLEESLLVVLDIFAQPNQKMVIKSYSKRSQFDKNTEQYEVLTVTELNSEGLNIHIGAEGKILYNRNQNLLKASVSGNLKAGSNNYNALYNVEVSPNQGLVLVRIANEEVLRAQARGVVSKELVRIDADWNVIGIKPSSGHLEIKNLNTLKAFVAPKERPNDKIQVSAALIFGQIADIRADAIRGGATKPLIHGTIKLDEANFLQSDYGVDSNNIQELVLKPIKSDLTNQADAVQNLIKRISDIQSQSLRYMGETLRKATPNFHPLSQQFVQELTKIKEEILADKTIRDISEFLHNIIVAFVNTFGETFSKFSELVESVARALTDTFGKVIQAIEKDLLPQLRAISEKVIGVGLEILNRTVEVALTYLAKVAEIAEKYKPELKQLGAALGEVSQDVVRVVLKAYENIRIILTEQWNELYNELKTLPIFEELKAQYRQIVEQGLPSVEILVNTLKDLQSTIKDIVPLEEFKVLVDAIGDYLEKKLTGKPVDDLAALEQIAKAFYLSIRRLIEIITTEGAPNLQNVNVPNAPANLLNKLPRLVAVKFSPINYLLREDVQGAAALALSLINKPRNLIPPFPLYGLVAQGQHIFTFDGKHLTFPGKCNYLLARDAVDGNFSVVGSYQNGQLAAITLAQDGNSVTLKKGGQVLLNNAPTDLPVHKGGVVAYRNYEHLDLVGDSGVHVICGPELLVCSVTISGFYHGKIRGLLGNGNNEPYDDFTLPGGKIVSSESDFGNSYKTGSGCGAVKAVESHVGHGAAPVCDKLFSWDSDLALCYPFVDNANFKTACQHGVAQKVKDTELAIAVAYVAACNQHNIPISVPENLVQCHNGDSPVAVGEKFSVKTPGKTADIVLIVNTVKSNEPVYKEYVQPLIQQLTNELHGQGISDVEYHLVTYGGETQWPTHNTVAGKLTFKGKVPNLKFTEEPKDSKVLGTGYPLEEFVLLLRSLGHDIELAVGCNLARRTFNEALNYPFRPNAVKAVIAVTGNPAEVGRLYPVQLLRTLLYRDKTVNLNLITPFDRLTVKDPKHSKDVVGFNENSAFTVAQTKNRPAKGGNTELRKEIDYSDYVADFFVNNNGNVFVTNNFLLAKGVAKKQFIQTTSHAIVDQLLGQEQGLDCECKLYTAFSAKNTCTVVNTKERTVKRTGTKS